MILTTTETISGRNLATLGLVQGNTIQSEAYVQRYGTEL